MVGAVGAAGMADMGILTFLVLHGSNRNPSKSLTLVQRPLVHLLRYLNLLHNQLLHQAKLLSARAGLMAPQHRPPLCSSLLVRRPSSSRSPYHEKLRQLQALSTAYRLWELLLAQNEIQ